MENPNHLTGLTKVVKEYISDEATKKKKGGKMRKSKDDIKLCRGGEYTLEEIAQKLGITRERVRQIEQQAIKKLRSPSVGRKLKAYLNS